MKKSILILLTGFFGFANAQIPTGYYDSAANLSGYALKTKLGEIITNGYQTKSYNALYDIYPTSDSDKWYEKDNSVLDIYSENPSGPDPYNYQHGSKQCGNIGQNEGGCYNREHLVPQSLFKEASPMVSDMLHILPTDGKVNGYRSHYPFGVINNPTRTSLNGSKLGPNATPGTNYFGSAFEPINEFKGDVARALLYFVTRYQTRLSTFNSGDILNTSNVNQGLVTWELNLLLLWHQIDPVSEREIVRNNAAYTHQRNRNPYVDHPEWVTKVWGTSPLSVDDANFSKNLNIAPNPVKGNVISVSGNKDLKQFKTAMIYNMVGQNVQTIENPFQNGNTIKLNNLPKGVYILKTGELNTKFIID
ncbi:Extracellular ribonuclease precursor [compost metagenome]